MNKVRLYLSFILCLAIFPISAATDNYSTSGIHAKLPDHIFSGIEVEVALQFSDSFSANDTIILQVNGINEEVIISGHTATLPYKFEQKGVFEIRCRSAIFSEAVSPIPLWLSLIPPCIAIILALIFREVVSSLLLGILGGSVILSIYSGNGISSVLSGFLAVIDHYILNAIFDTDHLIVILFSLLIGGLVSLISANGGMLAIIDFAKKFTKNPKSGQLSTWFLGLFIFFDDYANSLLVGNTMRPITDKLGISREKLSYIVDSTAAPVASIAFISTWIGAELGYIADGVKQSAEHLVIHENAYSIFFHSLQYSFYPILTLLFMLMLIIKGKDFGPMLLAEKKARTANLEELQAVVPPAAEDDSEIPRRWYNAVIPISVVILGMASGLILPGWSAEVWEPGTISFWDKLSQVVGQADSYSALLWSSFGGLTTGVLLTVSQRILSLEDSLKALIDGFGKMLPAIVILILAWGLSILTSEMHTADFIATLVSGEFKPFLVPAVTFVLAGLIAFSTGSSWGTMAILYPLIIPVTCKIGVDSGLPYDESMAILYNSISCVLAGSVLGDHCSPISDTTILSSLATSCNHINHVRTQLPYALTVGVTTLVFGTIFSALGVPVWACFLLCVLLLYFIISILGKKTDSTH